MADFCSQPFGLCRLLNQGVSRLIRLPTGPISGQVGPSPDAEGSRHDGLAWPGSHPQESREQHEHWWPDVQWAGARVQWAGARVQWAGARVQ